MFFTKTQVAAVNWTMWSKPFGRQLDALRAETQMLESVYQKEIADLEELKKSILQKVFARELSGGEPFE